MSANVLIKYSFICHYTYICIHLSYNTHSPTFLLEAAEDLFRGANGSLACFIFFGGVSDVKSTSSGGGAIVHEVCVDNF